MRHLHGPRPMAGASIRRLRFTATARPRVDTVAAVTTGDFDGDGYTDLAIGVPGEDWVAIDDGFVHVLYGGSGGLTTAGSDYWSQDSLGIFGDAENFDGFGQSLVAADF